MGRGEKQESLKIMRQKKRPFRAISNSGCSWENTACPLGSHHVMYHEKKKRKRFRRWFDCLREERERERDGWIQRWKGRERKSGIE